ncbi:hypothetical protein HZR84_14265 [Hyphobacterium sp. CCMP332]|nr:hypothetical protein HZR84_14265 [Hyphobacterium sp. CCMP332]
MMKNQKINSSEWYTMLARPKLRYPSERRRESGYDYFEARLYDSDFGRFLQVDPHSYKYPRVSPYIYSENNPVVFFDPNGKDPIFAKNFFGRTKQIGDDGKENGNVFLVSGKTRRAVKKATNEGSIYGGSLKVGSEVSNVPTGDDLQMIEDLKPVADHTQREQGFHTLNEGSPVKWDQGPKTTGYVTPGGLLRTKGTITPFQVNGKDVQPQDGSKIKFYMHFHTDHSNPDVQAGGGSTPKERDLTFQRNLEESGYQGQGLVVGTKHASFYNGQGVVNSVNYKDLVKMGRSVK